MKRSFGALGLLILCALAPAGVRADHGGGNTAYSIIPSAHPLEHGVTAVTVRFELVDFESLAADEIEAMVRRGNGGHVEVIDRADRVHLGIARGLTHDFSLGVEISLQDVRGFREFELHSEGGGDEVESSTADPSGIEDIKVRGLFRVARGARSSTAIVGGLSLPTGNDQKRTTEGEFLELGSQPSTGSLDAAIGLLHSRVATDRISCDLGVIYTARGQGPRGERVGNRLDAGVNVGIAINRVAQGGWAWGANLGLAVRHTDASRQASGEDEDNSGGTTLFLSPGISVGGSDWSFGLFAPIPVSEERTGEQQGLAFQLIGAVTARFGGHLHVHESDRDEHREPGGAHRH